jgi:cyclophilin family peptidyl-prolyl cis-trans isomerase
MRDLILFIILFTSILGCTPTSEKSETPSVTQVKLVTTKGEIVLKLYNETPQHRDNFIKIVSEGVLDSLLFHRVINSFMIQGGDIDSKYADALDTLGNGDLGYTVPAEISPNLFYKKGALGAARSDSPDRVSSSTQFYIVQGKVLNDSLLDIAEGRINTWLAHHWVRKDTAYSEQLDSLVAATEVEDWDEYSRINSNFRELAKDYENFDKYSIPTGHREVYKTIGGTPHLDQNYTVFGEVVSGLEVVDSIAAVATNDLDRPIEDVRILSVMILEDDTGSNN